MMRTKVGILNYGLGNLLSISRAFEKIGVPVKFITKPQEFDGCSHLVLPGVGAFSNGMRKLREHDFIDPLKHWHFENKPLLGICLGMQMMLDESYEFGIHKGLGLISGKVSPLKEFYLNDLKHKIPHIGWVGITSKDDQREIGNFYLVHSFASYTKDDSDTLGFYTNNKIKVPAIIRKNNTIGVQFHPEKSRNDGLDFLAYFLNIS